MCIAKYTHAHSSVRTSFRAYNHLMLCVAIIIHFHIVFSFPRTPGVLFFLVGYGKKIKTHRHYVICYILHSMWDWLGVDAVFVRASFAARVNILIMFTCQPKQMDLPFSSCVHISAPFFFLLLTNFICLPFTKHHFLHINYISLKKKKENRLTFTNPKICCCGFFSSFYRKPTQKFFHSLFLLEKITPQQFGFLLLLLSPSKLLLGSMNVTYFFNYYKWKTPSFFEFAPLSFVNNERKEFHSISTIWHDFMLNFLRNYSNDRQYGTTYIPYSTVYNSFRTIFFYINQIVCYGIQNTYRATQLLCKFFNEILRWISIF